MKNVLKFLIGIGAAYAIAFIAYKFGSDDGYQKGLRGTENQRIIPENEAEGEPLQPVSTDETFSA